jgi:hypothetical protein
VGRQLARRPEDRHVALLVRERRAEVRDDLRRHAHADDDDLLAPQRKDRAAGPAIDGSRQGKWQVWTKDGLLSEEGPYVGSVREGTWKIYTATASR